MLAGFLLSTHFALVSYINSSFLSSFISSGKVGLLYALAALAAILTLLFVPKILGKLGAYKFLVGAALLDAVALVCLSLAQNAYIVVPVFIIYWVLNSLIVFSLDETLEILTEGADIGRWRGLYMTILSSAWVLAQLFSSRLLVGYDFSLLYLVAFFVMLLFFVLVSFGLRNTPDPSYDKLSALKSLGAFFKNKNLARSYGINFLLQFFFSWMVIYTPIYMSQNLNFSWSEITMIFSIMLTAFVMIQYPLGIRSDKFGERKMLMAGFFIASLATVSLYFATLHSVFVWAALLFMTRAGAACIEIMSDVYFFKHIRKENDEFIGIYRNTSSVAYILGPLTASILFVFLPSFKFIFLILGGIMLIGVYLASTIEKSDI